MKSTTTTLQGGLRASEAQGTPISAEFEIEDGRLQLSVYTMKGDTWTEVVADSSKGAIKEAETIKDVDDSRGNGAKGGDGKGEGAPADRRRDGGERECRVPGGEHRPRVEERTGDRRGYLASGNDV
jgi:hypothetical protein